MSKHPQYDNPPDARELPSLEEIERRISETVKDIKELRDCGHGQGLDQYESDLVFLVHLKVEKQQQLEKMMIEGVPV